MIMMTYSKSNFGKADMKIYLTLKSLILFKLKDILLIIFLIFLWIKKNFIFEKTSLYNFSCSA